MRVTVHDRRLFLALLVAVIAMAWVMLWVWGGEGESPYGRYLDHEALSEIASEDVLLLAFFVAGWTLMVFAMMLPTSLPLIMLFSTLTRAVPTTSGWSPSLSLAIWASGHHSVS